MRGVKLDNRAVSGYTVYNGRNRVSEQKILKNFFCHDPDAGMTKVVHAVYQEVELIVIFDKRTNVKGKLVVINDYCRQAVYHGRELFTIVCQHGGILIGRLTVGTQDGEYNAVHLRDECKHSAVIISQPTPETGVVEVKALLFVNIDFELIGVVANVIQRMIPHTDLLDPFAVCV